MMPTGTSIMPGPHVEAARQQEVDVRLFQFELPGFFEPFDQRMLELQLADEADAVAEAVRDEQHKPMEIEAPIFELVLVEMEIHVARDRRRAFGSRAREAPAARSGRRRSPARQNEARTEGHESGRMLCHGFRM